MNTEKSNLVKTEYDYSEVQLKNGGLFIHRLTPEQYEEKIENAYFQGSFNIDTDEGYRSKEIFTKCGEYLVCRYKYYNTGKKERLEMERAKQKSKMQMFTGIIFIVLFLILLFAFVRGCFASGNIFVYGNLPPFEITEVKFDVSHIGAVVVVTERNTEKYKEFTSREGWVFQLPVLRVQSVHVFNLMYDADTGLIYFKLGTRIIPCALKKIKPVYPNHVYNLDMGCKLEVEKNMVWLEIED